MGENPDYSAVWAEARSRLAGLLDALGGKLAASDASEIRSYLNAREYGLAVETLASMIADGGKPICETDLREFDGIASLLGLDGEPFMERLHGIGGQYAGTRSS